MIVYDHLLIRMQLIYDEQHWMVSRTLCPRYIYFRALVTLVPVSLKFRQPEQLHGVLPTLLRDLVKRDALVQPVYYPRHTANSSWFVPALDRTTVYERLRLGGLREV